MGADFLWEFQGQETVRGGRNEPVAVKTDLGWVLSGPLKGESRIQPLNSVNAAFIETSLEDKVERFWDLDMMGIRQDRGIYAEITDDIIYDGERYSVGLKVRMVFDASSKEGKNGTSLNDCLHVGPNLTPLLFDILVRFRENNIGLVGDIEKAFLNVCIHEADRDNLHFL